jgi:hypothetical protein
MVVSLAFVFPASAIPKHLDVSMDHKFHREHIASCLDRNWDVSIGYALVLNRTCEYVTLVSSNKPSGRI